MQKLYWAILLLCLLPSIYLFGAGLYIYGFKFLVMNPINPLTNGGYNLWIII